MPSPIPSPLRSSLNWFKASHLRLLVAGIVAVGLISAISIFAAAPDEYTIPDPTEAELNLNQVTESEATSLDGEFSFPESQIELIPETGNEGDFTLEDLPQEEWPEFGDGSAAAEQDETPDSVSEDTLE